MVNLGGMLIDGAGGLGTEVSVHEVEVKSSDAVRTADAGELRAALGPLGSVVPHNLIVSPRRRANGALWSGTKGNGAKPSMLSSAPNGQMRYPEKHGSS